MNKYLLGFVFAAAFFSCKNTPTPDQPYILNIPPGFENPRVPSQNPVTKKKVELGELLFFDPILSDDSTISCSSCHIPERAFTDGKKVPVGINKHMGTRNSPTLVNTVYYPSFFAEGKVEDLETQAMAPGLHADEMGSEMKKMIFRLRKNKFYTKKFKEIFHEEVQPKHFVYVLASYERSLVAANNSYSRFKSSGDSSLMNADALKGMNLFFSERTNCSKCHNGNLFTDFSMQNIGLEKVYTDPGLARASSLAKDSGLFKTPTLLNVEYTSPYMHNGEIETLERVVDFYNSGGEDHPNKNKWIKPLNLSQDEKKYIVEFLKALTDEDLKQKTGIFKTPVLKYE